MRTHGLGRLYWHTVKLTGAPLVHRGKTSMTSQPYYWARPLIFSVPRGHGLVLGWWRKRKHLDVSAHLADALTLTDHPEWDSWWVLRGEGKFYGADPRRVP